MAPPSTPGASPRREFLAVRQFGSLDGLRAASILLVVWHHASGHGSRGYLGVDLFFAISGFLITTLLLREKGRTGTVALRGFYVRRTLRIFPLYFAVLGLYTALALWLPAGSAQDAEAQRAFLGNLPYFLTYTSNWFVRLDSGPRVLFYFAWSLATEEQFYLLWPWAVRGARSWAGPVLTMGALLAVDQLTGRLVGAGVWSGASLPVRVATSIATPICLGCLLGVALHHERSFDVARRLLAPRASAPLAALAVAVAIALPQVPDDAVAVVMPWLVGACAVREDHPLARVLASRPVAYVGTVSYGMYLVHMLSLNVVRRLLHGAAAPAVVTFALTAALALAVASVSYRFFERPFLRLKERFARA